MHRVIRWALCFIVCYVSNTVFADVLTAISSVPLISNVVKMVRNANEIELEEIRLSISEDMNNKGATKMHLVIVFDKELARKLKTMSSKEYFTYIKQLKKDNPDKMKVFCWKLMSKKRISNWIKVPYESDFMTAEDGFIFVKYDTPGDHRAAVPKACKKLRVELNRDDFNVIQADKEEKEKESEDENELDPNELDIEAPNIEDLMPDGTDL